MTSDSERLFEALDPPPGGLDGLRGRLARDAWRRRTRARALAGMAVLAVMAAGTWAALAPRSGANDLPPEFDLARMHLGLLPLPSEPVTIPEDRRGDTAVLRVPLPTDDVIFYMVGTTHD